MVLPSVARAEIVDRIVAIVEDDAIFLSQLEKRLRPAERQLAQIPDTRVRAERREQLYRETLERMIDDALIRRAASRAQLSVTPADIDRMAAGIAQQHNTGVDELYAAVETEGITREEYRQVLEAEVLRLRVMNVRIRGRVNISPSDLQEEYRRRVRAAADRAPFQVAHIFFAFSPNPTQAEIESVRARAAVVAQRLTDGADFAALALSASEDAASREAGGDLGTIDPDNPDQPAPDWLVNSVRSLAVGQVSRVTRGENGFHIFRLLSRQQPDVPVFQDVRDELYNELLNREMARQQRAYLRELRQRAAVDVRL
jgi:peptidyl-prolyl cis-trans isomerase SurA